MHSTLLFLTTRTALASPPYLSRMIKMPLHEEPTTELSEFWSKLIISVFLVLAGGVFAGWVGLTVTNMMFDVNCKANFYRLTLGLMGLDELHLRVLATSSEDLREKRNAQKGMGLGGLYDVVEDVLNVKQSLGWCRRVVIGCLWCVVFLWKPPKKYDLLRCYSWAMWYVRWILNIWEEKTSLFLDCQRKFTNILGQCGEFDRTCVHDFFFDLN